jgi:hypothetical protein
LPNSGNAFDIVGGTWSLITYDNDGQYQGTLYGEVTTGVISFVENNEGNITGKRTLAELRSIGFSGPSLQPRQEIIKATLEMITNLGSPQTSGTLDLDF